MTEEKIEQLKKDVESAFEKECEVSVTESGDYIYVRASAMFEHLPLNYRTLKELAVAFRTDNFDVNHYHVDGCETCDFGSSYTHEFSFRKEIGRY